jgi:hypothetical protein
MFFDLVAFLFHITDTPSLLGIHYPYSNCDTSLRGYLAFDLSQRRRTREEAS